MAETGSQHSRPLISMITADEGVLFDPQGKFHGWLMRRHADGPWISIRKLETADPEDNDLVRNLLGGFVPAAPPPFDDRVDTLALAVAEAVMGNPIVELAFSPGDERDGFRSDIQIEAARVLRPVLHSSPPVSSNDERVLAAEKKAAAAIEVLEWMRDRDERNGSLPDAFARRLNNFFAAYPDTRAVLDLKMTAITEGLPKRDELRGEQTILTYNDKVGTWDIAFMEAGWDDFDNGFAIGVTHWLDITTMWPGVIAQVASFDAAPRLGVAVTDEKIKEIAYHLCMHKDLKITLGQMAFVESAVASALQESCNG